MSNLVALLRTVAAGALCAITLIGCSALQPGSGPLGLDTVRLSNAIAIDDVGYVRGAVESKSINVNQSIPVTGYMEGTPLITVAARAGALKVLNYLIAAGANVNARTPVGETPVMLAAFFGDEGKPSSPRHEEAVRVLVAAGGAVDNEAHYYSPLAYAAYQGRDQTVRFLLDHGARVNAAADGGETYVNTPLMMASIMGHMDTVMMLLNAGADARIRVKDGHTARDLAAKYRHERLTRLLACAENLAPGEKVAGRCS